MRTDDEAPVIWKPTSGLAYSLSFGWGVLELDLVQPDLQLFRQQHRHRRIHALPHFDLIHDERDAAVSADANERIWREGGRRRRGGCSRRARAFTDPAAEQQPAAGAREHHHKSRRDTVCMSGSLRGVLDGGAMRT